MTPETSPGTTDHRAINTKTLVPWAAGHGRQYPWRRTVGYPLAVAEILLQKTRGDAIESTWHDLIRRYPTPAHLARANVPYLERMVASLGLRHQRAARLKGMARSWTAFAGDRVPAGLGPYGAAIVRLSLNKRPDTAPVDGNIARVVTRFHGWSFDRGEPRKKPETRNAVSQLIGRRKPENATKIIYALVDLGATVCLPRSPNCSVCPIRRECASRTGD